MIFLAYGQQLPHIHAFSISEVKNIQDQIVHLQHIVQLLPLINRDTLYVLLQFLGLVAENAEDRTDESGTYAPAQWPA